MFHKITPRTEGVAGYRAGRAGLAGFGGVLTTGSPSNDLYFTSIVNPRPGWGGILVKQSNVLVYPGPGNPNAFLRINAGALEQAGFVEWFEPDGVTSRAYLGFGSTNSTDFSVANEYSTGRLLLLTQTLNRIVIAAAGNVQINQPSNFTLPYVLSLSSDHTGGVGLNFNDTDGTPTSYDIGLGIGTGAASFVIYDRTAGVQRMVLSGTTTAFKITGYGPQANAQVDMTPDSGTFTGTLTGFASLTTSCAWSRNGNQVTLWINQATGTSNATTMTMTGLPAAIKPTRLIEGCCIVENNATMLMSVYNISAGGTTLSFSNGLTVNTAFTASGTKGIPSNLCITYQLN